MSEGSHAIIQINGNLYDAASGRMVTNANTRSMDIVAQPKTHQRPVSHAHTISARQHRTEKSHTLMRKAVRKPSLMNDVQPKSTAPVVQDRAYRASSTTQNSVVSRFAATQTLTPRHDANLKPVQAPQSPTHAPALQFRTTSNTHTAESFVAQQLEVATTPAESPFKKKPLHHRVHAKAAQHKILTTGSVLASLSILVGLLTYLSMPTIALSMASKKSGLSIHRPSSIPSTYSMDNKIYAIPGQITINYTSRTSDRKFALTLQKYDSSLETLKQDVVTRTHGQYQEYTLHGNTIYLYNSGQAEWANNGIRYSIQGQPGFTADQVAAISATL